MNNDLKQMITNNEKIMWEGRPNKKCYIFESIFNPLMPFALIWAIIDFAFIGFSFTAQNQDGMLLFIIPFFALHLMPVWLYLGGVLLCRKKYKNTYYIVTDKAIYISQGVITKRIQTKPFAEMSHIDLHRGIFDQMFNVGDIVCTSNQHSINGTVDIINIESVSNYTDVFNIIKKLQQDIYSDIMYPNDKRPAENHGYNTKYKG
ncbi:MAG: PH domain-containing protein [Bacilli bacterium]|nr:PH domain-containing protein [Bacilli bacterium]